MNHLKGFWSLQNVWNILRLLQPSSLIFLKYLKGFWNILNVTELSESGPKYSEACKTIRNESETVWSSQNVYQTFRTIWKLSVTFWSMQWFFKYLKDIWNITNFANHSWKVWKVSKELFNACRIFEMFDLETFWSLPKRFRNFLNGLQSFLKLSQNYKAFFEDSCNFWRTVKTYLKILFSDSQAIKKAFRDL